MEVSITACSFSRAVVSSVTSTDPGSTPEGCSATSDDLLLFELSPQASKPQLSMQEDKNAEWPPKQKKTAGRSIRQVGR